MKLIQKPVRPLPKDLPTIHDRIEFLRCVLGYPEKQFASKIGSGYQTLRKIVRGQVNPQMSTVNNIQVIFDVQPSWLFVGTGEIFKGDYTVHLFEAQGVKHDDNIDYEVNRRVRQIREGLSMTQILFADSIGVTKNQLISIENERNSISIPTLKKILVAHNIRPQWLLFGIGNRNAPKAS